MLPPEGCYRQQKDLLKKLISVDGPVGLGVDCIDGQVTFGVIFQREGVPVPASTNGLHHHFGTRNLLLNVPVQNPIRQRTNRTFTLNLKWTFSK